MYHAERVVGLGNVDWHKACLRCSSCKKTPRSAATARGQKGGDILQRVLREAPRRRDFEARRVAHAHGVNDAGSSDVGTARGARRRYRGSTRLRAKESSNKRRKKRSFALVSSPSHR